MSRLTASPYRAISALMAGIVIVVVVALMIGKAMPSAAPNQFWETLRIEGREVEHYSTLLEMLDAADAVVVARVSSVENGRTIHGDAEGDSVTYARVNLEVIKVIAGTAPTAIPLEFLVGGTPAGPAADIKALRDNIPSGSAVFFLHAKRGAGETGLYRLTNSTGLWAATTRAELDAPLQDMAPRSSFLYASELSSSATVDDLARLLARYASNK